MLWDDVPVEKPWMTMWHNAIAVLFAHFRQSVAALLVKQKAFGEKVGESARIASRSRVDSHQLIDPDTPSGRHPRNRPAAQHLIPPVQHQRLPR